MADSFSLTVCGAIREPDIKSGAESAVKNTMISGKAVNILHVLPKGVLILLCYKTWPYTGTSLPKPCGLFRGEKQVMWTHLTGHGEAPVFSQLNNSNLRKKIAGIVFFQSSPLLLLPLPFLLHDKHGRSSGRAQLEEGQLQQYAPQHVHKSHDLLATSQHAEQCYQKLHCKTAWPCTSQ